MPEAQKQRSSTNLKKQKAAIQTKVEYVINALVNLAMIYIVGKLSGWFHFFTSDFSKVLTLFYISYGITTLFYVIFLFYDKPLFKSIVKVVMNFISIVVLIRLLNVFPFDFSMLGKTFETIFKFVMILSIFGIIIGTVTEFGKSLVQREKGTTQEL